MKWIRRYQGVDIPSAGRFGSINYDEQKEALAGLSLVDGSPFLRFWLDPNPASRNLQASTGALRWRSGGAKTDVFATAAGGGVPTITTSSGRPILNIAAEARMLPETNAEAMMNPTAWSFWVAARLTTGNTNTAFLAGIGQGPTPASGQVWPNLEIYEDAPAGGQRFTVREYGGASTRRVISTVGALRGAWVIYGATFSTETGIALRRNGVEVARNSADHAALTNPAFALFANRSGVNPFVGDIGHIFTSDADGSAAEYQYATKRVEDFLLQAYGVTRGS